MKHITKLQSFCVPLPPPPPRLVYSIRVTYLTLEKLYIFQLIQTYGTQQRAIARERETKKSIIGTKKQA